MAKSLVSCFFDSRCSYSDTGCTTLTADNVGRLCRLVCPGLRLIRKLSYYVDVNTRLPNQCINVAVSRPTAHVKKIK